MSKYIEPSYTMFAFIVLIAILASQGAFLKSQENRIKDLEHRIKTLEHHCENLQKQIDFIVE